MPRNNMYFGCAATIECSYQPLDISFHPTVSTIVAAALVDGTVEVHDYSEMVLQVPPSVASMPKDNDVDDDEENDTIVSSTQVHSAPTNMAQAIHEPSRSVTSSSPSCRAIQFSNDGTTLWTGGNDGSIVALDTKQICTFTAKTPSKKDIFQYRITNAGYNGIAPIQVLYEIPERTILASGDDVGCVRLWDRRMLDTTSSPPPTPGVLLPSNTNNRKASPRGCVADWKVHDDYVSAILHSASSLLGGSNMENNDATNQSSSDNTLLSTSADGTLVVYDLRMTSSSNGSNINNSNNASQHETSLPYGVLRQSDPQDDELLSLCIMKNGRKVVCGTTEGVLSIFSYGTWGDVSDRYPGHPSSIDAILKIDEDTILTGSSDGLIRVVSIQPNQFVGVIGDNHEGFPIEQLQFTCDRSYVGSVTHDNYIRLWDARILDENYNDDDIDDDDEIDGCNKYNNNDDVKMAAVPMKTDNDDNDNNNSDEEWEDMDEDDDENSDDDDDDEEEEEDDDDDDMENDNDRAETKRGKKGSTKNSKRASRLKSERERFFDDL